MPHPFQPVQGSRGAEEAALKDGLEPPRCGRWQRWQMGGQRGASEHQSLPCLLGQVVWRADTSCVWGGKGAGSAPRQAQALAAWPGVCFQAFGNRHAVCSAAAEQRKTLGLLKSNARGICLFPLVILPLSSALWKFPSSPLSFPFPLLSLYLSYALPLLFPYFSFIPYWWGKGRISLFRDQIPLAHLFLTAVHGTTHPWVSKENVCICSIVTIPHEKRKSNSLLPFPASDALNSPSNLSSITSSVVIFPTIIQSQYLSWHLPGAMDPTVLHHNGRESYLVFFQISCFLI